MVGGMNDLCELINIWNFEILWRLQLPGRRISSWFLELALEVVLLENNSYLH